MKPRTWRAIERAPYRNESPLFYAEWLGLANEHPDQNRAWRMHEQLARHNYTDQRRHAEYYDIGGES